MSTVELAQQAELDKLKAQVAAFQAIIDNTKIIAESNSGILAVGEATMPRLGVATNYTPVANNTHFSYFTAGKTETISSIVTNNRNTAAVGTTDARLGVYEYNPTTNQVVLIASTANDTTLYNASFKTSTVPFITPFNKIAGKIYAVALRLTATTMPNFFGRQGELGQGSKPPLNGYSFGTDLSVGPFSAPTGVSGATFNIYYELRP